MYFWAESGRHNPKLKYSKMMRLIVADVASAQQDGRGVIAMRFSNKKEMDVRTLPEVSVVSFMC